MLRAKIEEVSRLSQKEALELEVSEVKKI